MEDKLRELQMIENIVKKKERWYFGGLAAMIVTLVVHPLDTIKVQLQTHQGKNIGVLVVGRDIVRKGGIIALYNGLSASLCRQIFYGGFRFGIYNAIRTRLEKEGRKQSFYEKAGGAAVSGAIGAFWGTPWDLVNVRMQNDIKLPPEQRRNYKWAGDGFIRVLMEEGIVKTWSGATFVMIRGAMMTIGQLAFYDTIKAMLLATPYFEENIGTHFTASISAATIATLITQPLDVVKTRIMNAKPGQYSGYGDVIVQTAKTGPQAFFKGMVPAFIRIAPMTIGIFITLEQLIKHFGIPA